MIRALAAGLAVAAMSTPAVAQDTEQEQTMEHRDEKQAVEDTIARVYAAISGGVGEERDWDAMRALYTPDARLTALRVEGPWSGSVEDYIARSGPFLVERGFTESALVNRIEVYGNIAHAWSSYAGTWTEEDGTQGAVRGINSFQLRRQDDGRWLVHSIFWQAETPDTPLPADMEDAP